MMMASVSSVSAKTAAEEASVTEGVSDYYEEQMAKYEGMKDRTIDFTFSNTGIYTVKYMKLYTRQVEGVEEDGSFIIGPWKLVKEETKRTTRIEMKLPGTCVLFAFGFDILWGTDWPYSGVFWDKVDVPVNNIFINSSGLVRTASLKIEVNGNTVFDDWNLPSHSEWKPW